MPGIQGFYDFRNVTLVAGNYVQNYEYYNSEFPLCKRFRAADSGVTTLTKQRKKLLGCTFIAAFKVREKI